jgi:hypothetical protein
MSLTSLVINSNTPPPAKEYTWEKIINPSTFAKGIQTQSFGDAESDDISKLGSVISGMPTVFARSNMFDLAFRNCTDKSGNTGLLAFYQSLISEWRGLVTAIALNPDKIEAKRINLSYSEGETMISISSEKLYEPKGSFGSMLFDRAEIWSNPNDDKPSPFIDVIIYKKSDGTNMVIGGTSPDSLFFTSTNYNMSGEDAVYINDVKSEDESVGVFTDPLKSKNFDPQSLKTLYSYVSHMIDKMNDFTAFFKSTKIIDAKYHADVFSNLQDWKSEMDAYRHERDIPEYDSLEVPQINNFQTPYSIFANYSTSISALDGLIYDGEEDGGITFSPEELLLPNTTKIACVDDDGDKDFLKDKPLLLLKADVEGEPNEVRHFMLPLSPKGIKVFGKNLGSILGFNDNSSVKSKIKATYNTAGDLSVVIKLISQTKTIGEYKEQYKTTNDDVSGKDLLIWPNFISSKWNKYFLFSEMPHNSATWKAIPFCFDNKDLDEQQMIMSSSDSEMPDFLAVNGHETDVNKAKLKIEFNRKKVSGTNYEYEIYESKNPFKGFQLCLENNVVGYAVIEYGNDPKSPIRKLDELEGLREAHLGVDFGSTNSAIAYRVGAGDAEGFTFRNRRVSLLAPKGDAKDNKVYAAGEDEVFFFQTDEIQSNAIKSVLTLHNKNRMKDDKGHGHLISLAKEEVKGGFPCFEKNLPIEDSTANSYLLKFRHIGQATLIHNMKWSLDESSEKMNTAYRTAYLKSLLLQVYSDLFSNNLYPSTLKWAYPSAMGNNLINVYNDIWQDLTNVNPLGDQYPLDVMIGSGDYSGIDAAAGAHAWTGDSSPSRDDIVIDDKSNDSWRTTAPEADSGWGTTNEPQKSNQQSGVWGDEKPKAQKPKEISLDDSAISFDFQKIEENKAMTESCAVANYLAESGKINATTHNTLTLCFDIGGSTTDILVLGQMIDENKNAALSMVKQSSIRFAARRIAQATKYSPNFRQVLVEQLDKKGIKVEGINNGGDNKFNKNTAPYYFEQLVDRLDDTEFDDFYRALGVHCKEMVSVNTYVTGLIVFYAGQIARKVKMEIDKSDNKTAQWCRGHELGEPNYHGPLIQIQFTGKGSRIMDWLKAINPSYDQKYYMDMFINGFGGMEEAKKHLGSQPVFMPRDNSSDVKYEVAKGLAYDTTKLYIPKTDQKPLEVIGEDGFVLFSGGKERKLSYDDSITTELMSEIGNSFAFIPKDPNKPCPQFMKFAHLYFQVATQFFDLKATQQDFMNGFKNINIADYIRLLPEFKEALRTEKKDGVFDFVAPIIILEGMQFFENVILKKMSSN